MKITRLQHALLHVKNLEEAKAFYKEILGFEEMERWLINPIRDGAWFKIGDTRLHLALWEERGAHSNSDEPPDAWDNHIAFEVDDIEAWKKKLEEKGISYLQGVMGGEKMAQIYFRDPSGNEVELIHHNVPI